MTRSEILDKAKEYVNKDRNSTYGNPEDNFGDIARLWSAYKDADFTPQDVAIMSALVKVARLKKTPTHEDSWVDLAGYAACGGSIAPPKKPVVTGSPRDLIGRWAKGLGWRTGAPYLGHILAYNEANDEFKLVDPDYGTVFVRADSIELIPGPDDPREDA